MNRIDYEAWLGALSPLDKVFALLAMMHGLTIAMRSISINYQDEPLTKWRLAYKISEMNHAFTSAAQSAIDGISSYSDSDLIAIFLDHANNPELEPECREVLETTFQLMRARRDER